SQKRIYAQHQLKNAETAYNMPFIWNMNHDVEIARLKSAIDKLVQRHDSLRTIFVWFEGELVQRILGQAELEMEYSICEEHEIYEQMTYFIRPFYLDEAPLFRMHLLKIASDRHVLLFDMHHIISDGVSISVFMEELMALYDGAELEPLRLQYKDVAVWQHNYRSSAEYEEHEKYWLSIYGNEKLPPPLELPTDYVRPDTQSFTGGRVGISVEADVAVKLKRLCLQSGTTMFMVLLSAYYILLEKFSGQDDIVIGTTIAGRNHPDFEEIIGVFVNAIAIRNAPRKEKMFKDFLLEVKESTLHAYKHQNYPFEELVDQLNIRRDVSRNPLFDTMLVFHNQMSGTMPGMEQNIDLNLLGDIGHHAVKFDLTLNAVEINDTLHLLLEYCKDLYRTETAEMLLNCYCKILVDCINEPTIQIAELEILSTSEKQHAVSQILVNRDKALPSFDL
ncbi:condensation domain-containing protein, partial [Paenibacillus sp. YSY-4.3]